MSGGEFMFHRKGKARQPQPVLTATHPYMVNVISARRCELPWSTQSPLSIVLADLDFNYNGVLATPRYQISALLCHVASSP